MIKPLKASVAHTEQVIASFQTAQGTSRWQGQVPFLSNFNIWEMKTSTLSHCSITILHSADLNPPFNRTLIPIVAHARILGLCQRTALFQCVLTQSSEDFLIHGGTRIEADRLQLYVKDTSTPKEQGKKDSNCHWWHPIYIFMNQLYQPYNDNISHLYICF